MSEIGEPPVRLDEVAAAKWREVTAPEIWGRRLKPAHRDALERYCAAWSRLRAFEAKIAQDGELVGGPNGFPIAHPLRAQAAALEKELHRQALAFARIAASKAWA